MKPASHLSNITPGEILIEVCKEIAFEAAAPWTASTRIGVGE